MYMEAMLRFYFTNKVSLLLGSLFSPFFLSFFLSYFLTKSVSCEQIFVDKTKSTLKEIDVICVRLFRNLQLN